MSETAEPFKCIEEVRDYLSGKKIVCLICGNSYIQLASHTFKTHGVSGRDYRLKFNIPQSVSLVTEKVHCRKLAIAAAHPEVAANLHKHREHAINAARETNTTRKREVCAITRKNVADTLLANMTKSVIASSFDLAMKELEGIEINARP